jgi:hypothetical protein
LLYTYIDPASGLLTRVIRKPAEASLRDALQHGEVVIIDAYIQVCDEWTALAAKTVVMCIDTRVLAAHLDNKLRMLDPTRWIGGALPVVELEISLHSHYTADQISAIQTFVADTAAALPQRNLRVVNMHGCAIAPTLRNLVLKMEL